MTSSQKLQLAQRYFQFRQFDEALALVKSLLKSAPQNSDLVHFMGGIQSALGQHVIAVETLQRAIKLNPGQAMYFFSLGSVLAESGQTEKAIVAYREAARLNPQMVEASFNLGNVLRTAGRDADAILAYQSAIAAKPDFAEALSNLGDALRQSGRLDEAITMYRRALQWLPNSAQVHSNLGLALQRQGRVSEALQCFATAVSLQPAFAVAASNELLATQYSHEYSAAEIFAKHQQFGQRFEALLQDKRVEPSHVSDPERRLKVGYVSPDLRGHSVASFIGPVLRNHDKTQFEIFCYYSNSFRDAVTDQIEADVDHWLTCDKLTDDELAARIRSDGIDILVDLSGHTAGNRLLVFARRAAPVQVTWIGYPGTTGLSAMDYRITDHDLDPVGVTEAFHTERLVRLSAMTPFTPAADSPCVNALPALSGAPLTLASLNNVTKFNVKVIETWSAILRQLPGSRLVLGNAGDEGTRQWLQQQFAQFGIDADRLVLKPKMSKAEYLALHHEIDLALDPYPYNGGTTTLHSLWMGAPVVTLRGDRAAALQGASTLAYAGLHQFIANDEEDYVRIAVRYGQNLNGLNDIRQSVRQSMASRSQGDSSETVRQLEQLYRQMWRDWCAA